MTNPNSSPAGETAGKVRPAVVTIGVSLLFLMVVLNVLQVVMAFAEGDAVADAVAQDLERQGAAQDQIDMIAQSGTEAFSIGTVLVPTLAILILGIFVLKGVNGARIATWIVGGLTALCTSAALGFGMLMGDLDGVDVSAAYERGMEEASGLYGMIVGFGPFAAILVLIVGLVLLALPAANPFFRKPAPEVNLPPEAG